MHIGSQGQGGGHGGRAAPSPPPSPPPLITVRMADDEQGSFGMEIDGDGTVVAYTYHGAPAELAGVPLGGVGAPAVLPPLLRSALLHIWAVNLQKF